MFARTRLCAASVTVLAAPVALSMALSIVASGPGSGGAAEAAPLQTYPLNKVKRGQTGYGFTTFKGTTPERFTFEVVSVVKNFLPKQDIILVKSDDPKMQLTGFWQGMSGSPLYIEDKLVCAFSYGFRFNKIPLGGCTPIDYMKREGLDTIRRGAPGAGGAGMRSSNGAVRAVASGAGAGTSGELSTASMADWRRLTPKVDAEAALAALGPPRQSWLLSAPMPALPSAPRPGATEQTLTASVPLSVAGFTAPAFADLGKLMAGYNLEPMRAGGTGAPTEDGPREFVMGGSIAVQLVRGDMSMAATGTVSYVDGNHVLAFGHPLFQTGESYAPVSTSYVHTIVPSAQSAFVSASPAIEIGSLVQDRQSAISADTKLRSPMIPLDIEVITGTGTRTEKGDFRVEIIDNKFLTATFAALAAGNAVNYYLPDRDDVTAKVFSTVRIKGVAPISFVDYLYANDGASSMMGGVRGLRVLVPLLLNPFAPVTIEGIELKVDLRFDTNYGEIKSLQLPSAMLVPGARNLVNVAMETWNGDQVIEAVAVDVPAALAGAIVQLEVTAGDSAKLDAAPPVDLASLISAFRKMLPGNVWAVSLYVAEDGVSIDGQLVRDLPASAADKLRPGSRTQRAVPFRTVARTVSPAKRVINGTGTLMVRVADGPSPVRGATP
jgi:SpoIVB peptidase S55